MWSPLTLLGVVFLILLIWAWWLGPGPERKTVQYIGQTNIAMNVAMLEARRYNSWFNDIDDETRRLYECNFDHLRKNPAPRESAGEKLCREFLEKRFGLPFINCRPYFLRNPETQQFLELDCYNNDMKLAVEYQGAQHYNYPNYFHRTKQEFTDQIKRDIFKKDMCEQMGVILICVPWHIQNRQIPKYIENLLPYEYQVLPWPDDYWRSQFLEN